MKRRVVISLNFKNWSFLSRLTKFQFFPLTIKLPCTEHPSYAFQTSTSTVFFLSKASHAKLINTEHPHVCNLSHGANFRWNSLWITNLREYHRRLRAQRPSLWCSGTKPYVASKPFLEKRLPLFPSSFSTEQIVKENLKGLNPPPGSPAQGGMK